MALLWALDFGNNLSIRLQVHVIAVSDSDLWAAFAHDQLPLSLPNVAV